MSKLFPIALMAAFVLLGYNQNSAAAPSPVQSSNKTPAGSSDKEAAGSSKKKSKTAEQEKSDTTAAASKPDDSKEGSDSKTAATSAKEGTADADSEVIVIEEDFWYPFRYSFADAIHDAHVNYREGREKEARDEINKAINWLKLAKGMAGDKESEESLEVAISDLRDMSMFLKNGDIVRAANMELTFARAANVLAKHHNFKAKKAVAQKDMEEAARHLSAAVFNIERAAKNAGHEYGDEVVAVVTEYGPGEIDETAVLEKNKLEQALDTIAKEIGTIEEAVKKAAK